MGGSGRLASQQGADCAVRQAEVSLSTRLGGHHRGCCKGARRARSPPCSGPVGRRGPLTQEFASQCAVLGECAPQSKVGIRRILWFETVLTNQHASLGARLKPNRLGTSLDMRRHPTTQSVLALGLLAPCRCALSPRQPDALRCEHSGRMAPAVRASPRGQRLMPPRIWRAGEPTDCCCLLLPIDQRERAPAIGRVRVHAEAAES